VAAANIARDSERAAAAVEIPCPSCGEPMLAGWGTTCGKCRPNLVSPKTIFPGASPSALGSLMSKPGGMTLGWLVVLRSIDRERPGQLYELEGETNVLTRAGGAPAGATAVISFSDTFISNAHAVVRRPVNSDRTGAFTIQDRVDPGPSANGTFVNAHKLAPGEVARLSDGDVIKLGATELLFKSLWLPGGGAPTRP
jgi:hypothetical protein